MKVWTGILPIHFAAFRRFGPFPENRPAFFPFSGLFRLFCENKQEVFQFVNDAAADRRCGKNRQRQPLIRKTAQKRRTPPHAGLFWKTDNRCGRTRQHRLYCTAPRIKRVCKRERNMSNRISDESGLQGGVFLNFGKTKNRFHCNFSDRFACYASVYWSFACCSLLSGNFSIDSLYNHLVRSLLGERSGDEVLRKLEEKASSGILGKCIMIRAAFFCKNNNDHWILAIYRKWGLPFGVTNTVIFPSFAFPRSHTFHLLHDHWHRRLVWKWKEMQPAWKVSF